MNAGWLADAAAGDGAALSRLRRHVETLLVVREHPLHIGSVITTVIAGWDGRCYPEEIFDHPELFEEVQHRSTRPTPVPPGALAVVPTATKLGDLYGEVICSHPDPDVDQYEVDGQLTVGRAARHRAVVAFDCMPDALRVDLDTVEIARIRRAGTWLTAEGHVLYRALTPMPEDAIELYSRWLAQPERAAVRNGLPDDPDRITMLAAALLDELAGYRATFVTFGRWVWLRESYGQLLGDQSARLSRDELRFTIRLLSATYGSARAHRTVAFELAEAAASWPDGEREQATVGTGWVSSLFTANAFVAERLSGGAPIVRTRDGPVQLAVEPGWELAGLWRIDALDPERVEELKAEARAEAEDRAIAAMGRELAEVSPFPFTLRLSEQQFEKGVIELPREVPDQLTDGPVTVRLAFRPQGRFATRPVAAASSGRPDADGRMPLDWPALLPVGATIDGRVLRRGRLVELKPA